MKQFFFHKRLLALLMSVLMLMSVAPKVITTAADGEIGEEDTYVLNRDSSNNTLFLFQSPSKLGYDYQNKYSSYTPNNVGVQAIIYNMRNTVAGTEIPTYCIDIFVTAEQGFDYRRMNLEDSSYSAPVSGMIRAILEEGFYIVPAVNDSMDDVAAKAAADTAALAEACGVPELTTGEAIAATQAALWRIVHGPELRYPTFCRTIMKLSNTKYASVCSYDEINRKGSAAVSETIETVYNYLISLDPVEAQGGITVSPASFTDLNDPVYVENADGSYDITVNASVYVEMAEGDSLTATAKLGDYKSSVILNNGKQTISMTLKNVPASLVDEDVKLSISGYQTSKGFFLFDAVGARTESQTMVGYDNSRLPVYAEVVAKEERVLNIVKSTTDNSPLGGIFFDIYKVAEKEENESGAVILPEDPADYVYKKASYGDEYPVEFALTLITDKNGKASANFLHHGLPDGVYILKEQIHPSIVAPIEPMYLYVPSIDPNTHEEIYNITIWPKNEIKGGVKVEKDVLALGNDEASLHAYEPNIWIISSTIPDDLASSKSYVVTDTLDSRLDYMGNVTVVLETKEGTAVEPLVRDTDYTLSVTDVDSLSEGKPSDSFAVSLTDRGMSKIVEIIGANAFKDYMLRTYFHAQINANAQMGVHIPNQANVTYRNAANFDYTAKSEEVNVYTGGFHLLKTDASDQTITLSGAVFEVYRPATFEETMAADPRLTNIPGVPVKVVKIPFYVGAVAQGAQVTSVTTGADGKISVCGLAYGTYYLVEKAAPEGYTPLREAFEITVDSRSHLADNVIVIKNLSGVLLPETGGIGTTIFTLSGTLLLCVAAILFYLKKCRVDEG